MLALDKAALVFAVQWLQRWNSGRFTVVVHGDHREETAVGVAHRALTDIFGNDLDANFHRGVAGVVDRGEEGHQLTDMNRLAENDLVHRQGDHITPRIAAGAGIGDFIEVLEQGSAVNIARKIGHVRGHQDRHRQLGVSGFHSSRLAVVLQQ